jgi:hypothetical protein
MLKEPKETICNGYNHHIYGDWESNGSGLMSMLLHQALMGGVELHETREKPKTATST